MLAHEFGHFSQNSLRLGNYVYTSNRVIAELVFRRDWLDELVSALKGFDIRLAIFAWVFAGILWVSRKLLQGFFRVLNFANFALTRQMEFNADLVAVSVTGSDGPIHALLRLDFAVECLTQAWSDVNAAADKQLYTNDLFYHQTRAVEHLRAVRHDPNYGEPPALPQDPRHKSQVFQPSDTSVPKMWATHPSNFDREVNAKRHDIRSPIDERSPWLLFQNASALREQMTRWMYQAAERPEWISLKPPEVVQAFIDEEHTGATYDARYHGLYDHRHVALGELNEIVRSVSSEAGATDRLADAYARLYGDELKQRMEAHRVRQEEYRHITPLAAGAVELTGSHFVFRDKRYIASDAPRLLAQVKKELDQDFEWMGLHDQETFRVHYRMARQVGEEVLRELVDRYRFQLAVQELHSRLNAHNQQVHETMSQLVGKAELTQLEFYGAIGILDFAHGVLRDLLENAGRLALPALKNFTPGELLGPNLLSEHLISSPNASALDVDWIRRFLTQLGEVIDKAHRIHIKSLGEILALQDGVAKKWSESESTRGGANEPIASQDPSRLRSEAEC